LDALRSGGADALVESQGLSQICEGSAGIAGLQKTFGESFMGTCPFGDRADVARNGQCLRMQLVGPRGVRGPGCQLSKPVERFGTTYAVTQVAE
jgi:hypothetical protein